MNKKTPGYKYLRWLAPTFGKDCLDDLTTSELMALVAAVEIMALRAYDDHPSVIIAYGLVVRRMRPSAWPLAYHLMAHIDDWDPSPPIWADAGLPPITPGGRGVDTSVPLIQEGTASPSHLTPPELS
jgi:hypothetical protein